jgi:hypothetical protein
MFLHGKHLNLEAMARMLLLHTGAVQVDQKSACYRTHDLLGQLGHPSGQSITRYRLCVAITPSLALLPFRYLYVPTLWPYAICEESSLPLSCIRLFYHLHVAYVSVRGRFRVVLLASDGCYHVYPCIGRGCFNEAYMKASEMLEI